MKKNSKKALFARNVTFNCGFCDKKFSSQSKCIRFYETNRNLIQNEVVVCPYGYTCIFGNESIISSIVDDTYCNLKLVLSRDNYSKRNGQKTYVQNIVTSLELQQMIDELKNDTFFHVYRDTFHDLNNNNRYLIDCFDSIPNYIKNQNKDISFLINALSSIFLSHKKLIEAVSSDSEKLSIYRREINSIEDFNKQLLSLTKTLDHSSVQNLKRNLEFIDFRIRYLKRIVDYDGDYHKTYYIKRLKVMSILTKLKYAFANPAHKKNQVIKINNDFSEELQVEAYDDVYLAFFILYENAIKYAPFNTTISITISIFDENVYINISNVSEYIGENVDLCLRGVQGDNKKDGNGLGLTIANEIFLASKFYFKAYFDKQSSTFNASVSFKRYINDEI